MVIKLLTFLVLLEKYCSASKTSLRVIGGRNAARDEFPFVVRLDRTLIKYEGNKTFELYEHFCTGSIIAPTWTLTAAHCLFWINNKNTDYVIYIRYNSYFPENKGEVSKVLEYRVHPRFRLDIKYMRYDIALVETENAIVSKYAKLSAVDYRTLFGHEAYGMGFGLTNVTGNPPPLQVLKGMLNICSDKIDRPRILAGVCLKTPCNIEASMTPGNSGGPLLHTSGIVAVLSMGETKYLPNKKVLNFPQLDSQEGIYNSISPTLDWILTIVRRKSKFEINNKKL